MKKTSTAFAALTAVACVLSAAPATAQYQRDSDRDGRPDSREWNRDRDRDGRPDQWDRSDRRSDRWSNRNNRQNWRHYGGRYGYEGYRGNWRTGMRYPHYNDRRYYVSDYRRYNLPPPSRGYRYYRDDSGDIVMVAIASGLIGAILGSSLDGRR